MPLPRTPKIDYTTRQMTAIGMGATFIFISFYVFMFIHESIVENANIEQPRIFHLPFDYNFYNESVPPDIQMDLEVHYPRGILIEGDPVNISGVAVANTRIAQKVLDVAISFQNAQVYPTIQDDRGITKGISLNLLRSPDGSKLVGNTTVVWNIVGTYYPRLYVTRLQDNGRLMIHPSETKDVAITVYPKSQLVQIVTNKATLLLACAAYLIALVGAFNILYSLWKVNPLEKNEGDKSQSYTEKKSTTKAKDRAPNKTNERRAKNREDPNNSSQPDCRERQEKQ
jgi:hypothetical protein